MARAWARSCYPAHVFASERLETAILADRDDAALYLVLADELQERGDPRGELVVMQNQIQSTDDPKARHALQRQCDEWIARHDLLGPLRDFGRSVFGRHAEVTWRYGFIRCLEIGWGPKAGDTPETARRTLEAILRHPSSRFITLLVLGPAPGTRDEMDMQCLVDAIAETGCPKALRSLHLGKLCDWPPAQTSTGDLSHASAALGRLQKLTLEAGTVTIGELALPELVELRIMCISLDDRAIEELCAIRCPKLRTLKITCMNDWRSPGELTSLLRARLPHVRNVSATTRSNALW